MFDPYAIIKSKLFYNTKALKLSDESAQFCTMSYRAPELFDPPTGIELDSRFPNISI